MLEFARRKHDNLEYASELVVHIDFTCMENTHSTVTLVPEGDPPPSGAWIHRTERCNGLSDNAHYFYRVCYKLCDAKSCCNFVEIITLCEHHRRLLNKNGDLWDGRVPEYAVDIDRKDGAKSYWDSLRRDIDADIDAQRLALIACVESRAGADEEAVLEVPSMADEEAVLEVPVDDEDVHMIALLKQVLAEDAKSATESLGIGWEEF